MATVLLSLVPLSRYLTTPGARQVALEDFRLDVDAPWHCVDGSGLRWALREDPSDRHIERHCSGLATVQLVSDQFLRQEQGREVADYFSGIKGDTDNRWREMERHQNSLTLDSGATVEVTASVMRGNATGTQVLVYSWYQVDDVVTSSPAGVKLIEARRKLLGQHRVSTRVYLATPLKRADDFESASSVLDSFLRSHGDELLAALAATRS